MCGIFGLCTKPGHQINHLKLKVLGLYNRSRGIDSCGYYYNGNIVKGFDRVGVNEPKEADIGNFLANNQFIKGDLKMSTEVLIGHTRKATGGLADEENAHPYKINEYIQAHNGVIKNIDDLVKKYNIENQFAVDSQGLALLIAKEGWKVLEEYIGYAALAMTYMSEPDRLFLFHGASRDKPTDQYAWWERPMFTLQQPEGLYYSSIEESLKAISSDDTEPRDLPYNVVCEIKDGELTNFEYKINRYGTNAKKAEPKVVPSDEFFDINANDMIKFESIPINSCAINQIYYKKSRFYLNNQLLSGACFLTPYGIEVDKNSGQVGNFYYFIKGVLINSIADYLMAKDLVLSDYFNIAAILSPFSRYPVFNLETESIMIPKHLKNKWYADSKIVLKETFEPIFSTKKYKIANGKTSAIT